MTTEPCILVKEATKSYGPVCALRGLDLEVAPGECVALIGHNGAGKTTLIKLILGLAQLTSGSLSVMGYRPNAAGFASQRKAIGFMPEQANFHGSLTGRQTLAFYARLKGVSRRTLDDLFQKVDLVEASARRVATYSKGMRQRLGLAQALLGSPHVLILDEPTTGLDPDSRARVYSIIEEKKADGVAVLLSSHALTELEARADRVAILDKGRLRACGSIPQLRERIGLEPELRIRARREEMTVLAGHFGPRFGSDSFANGVAVLKVPAHDKLILLKEVLNLGLAIDDVTVVEPNLEQIFTACTGRSAAQ
jgi:Cu-processing system ATP-binding protein